MAWLQLGVLALVVLAVPFLIFAPITTISIRFEQAPGSVTAKPTPIGDLVQLALMHAGTFVLIYLVIGVIAVAGGIAVWAGRKVILAQPKSDA